MLLEARPSKELSCQRTKHMVACVGDTLKSRCLQQAYTTLTLSSSKPSKPNSIYSTFNSHMVQYVGKILLSSCFITISKYVFLQIHYLICSGYVLVRMGPAATGQFELSNFCLECMMR